MRLLLLISFMMALNCSAQLVNIESRRMQSDTVRVAGNANLQYSYQKTNGITASKLDAALAFQFKSKSLRNIFLTLGSYDIARSFDKTSNHAGFGHFRYNYKINPWLRWEAYTQLQFNELLSLKTRALAGTGARFKILKGDVLKSYVGISSFLEYEEVRDPNISFTQDVRMSNYFVITIKFPNDRGEFTSVTYYQPLFKAFNDYRINTQNALVFKITKHLAFTTRFNYFIDSNPPLNVDREVFSLENGLRFAL